MTASNTTAAAPTSPGAASAVSAPAGQLAAELAEALELLAHARSEAEVAYCDEFTQVDGPIAAKEAVAKIAARGERLAAELAAAKVAVAQFRCQAYLAERGAHHA